ncbi:MAG: hypothetical protein JXR77_07605 [Lentisphaeria bacterium]|nr:hypothetical protein [Lentisphaeria bacterium]
MAAMTGRERLEAVFARRVPDRPALKLWGCDPARRLRHTAYEPVRERAMVLTDLVLQAGSPFSLYAGRHTQDCTSSTRRPTADPEWVEVVTVLHTPEGDLEQVFLASTSGRPGYHRSFYLKEPEDIRRLLSLPYEPYAFSADSYAARDSEAGSRGIAMFGLDHAMYGLQRLVGSENFALWSWEHRDLLLEAIEVFAGRIRDHARRAIEAGIRGVFGWVGPELCIPPLMSPAHFDRFVAAVDRPLLELIHHCGGRVWVHCHGRMGPVLERFLEMGVDVLNPIEPPPMGDITLEEAFRRVGGGMGLEGNIETHDIMTGTPETVHRLVTEALRAGAGQPFILCPCSGFDENAEPSPAEIRHWLAYVEAGFREAERLRG